MGALCFSPTAVASSWTPPPTSHSNLLSSGSTPVVLLNPSSLPPHTSSFPLHHSLKLGAPIPLCPPTNVCSASNSSSSSGMSSMTIQRHRSAAAELVGGHLTPDLVQQMISEALVWCSLHGLLVGDKKVEKSGTVPGIGLVHAPFALLPVPFPESHWRQACELASIFNELVDRVSLDAEFLQETLSRRVLIKAYRARWHPSEEITCVLCGEEYVEHLFFGCRQVDLLQSEVGSEPLFMTEFWEAFPTMETTEARNLVLLFLSVWRMRNNVVFGGASESVDRLRSMYQSFVVGWGQ